MLKNIIINEFYSDKDNERIKTLSKNSLIAVFVDGKFDGCAFFNNEQEVIGYVISEKVKSANRRKKYKLIIL